jgi:atypical dual specificity phosphatase
MSKIIYTDTMKLYLGNACDATDEVNLNKQKINTIICLAEEVKIINPNITIYKYNLQDSYECNISLYFDEICDLIHKQDVVLVNCVAGISRSASFVIAYLMKYYEMNLQEAFLYVRKRRNIICPNKKFMTYLYEYEFKMFGENSITYDECVKLFYFNL